MTVKQYLIESLKRKRLKRAITAKNIKDFISTIERQDRELIERREQAIREDRAKIFYPNGINVKSSNTLIQIPI